MQLLSFGRCTCLFMHVLNMSVLRVDKLSRFGAVYTRAEKDDSVFTVVGL